MGGGRLAGWWGGALLAVAALVLAGCGDGGSASSRASTVAGSTAASGGTSSEAEVQGVVSDKAGTCPAISFKVSGVSVQTNSFTEFNGTSCASLANGNFVKVEGPPLGAGTIQAREVELRAAAAPAGLVAAVGVTVSLVGPTTVSQTTNGEGKFEFENVPAGTYDLRATAGGATCTLSSGINLLAQKNEVEGELATSSSPPTCGSLVLVKLEVEQET